MSSEILVTGIFNSCSHKFIILRYRILGSGLMNPLGAKVACLRSLSLFRRRSSLIIEIENINSDSATPTTCDIQLGAYFLGIFSWLLREIGARKKGRPSLIGIHNPHSSCLGCFSCLSNYWKLIESSSSWRAVKTSLIQFQYAKFSGNPITAEIVCEFQFPLRDCSWKPQLKVTATWHAPQILTATVCMRIGNCVSVSVSESASISAYIYMWPHMYL